MTTRLTPLQIIALRAETSVDRLAPTATLEEVGIDSLGLMEIALSMKTVYGVDIPEGELYAEQSVADAVEHLTRRIGAAQPIEPHGEQRTA